MKFLPFFLGGKRKFGELAWIMLYNGKKNHELIKVERWLEKEKSESYVNKNKQTKDQSGLAWEAFFLKHHSTYQR